ncbi:hypothetical protein, variant [Aphanomyces astaci]|uniref:Deacetylase sirtuin-type domain-containing protein n=1 Tax=Aphanomyces astaci TaxID=112090 RepID=W4H038_APHAT|nr:hypothetical protein, variant [Aphanomyces astaci]ETV85272.1 hypothetical protein, variant [Aphanomyces astaci]|eukprot:XP_009825290.1 hypothetical protein, variant [Aphanomyces astaci]
MDTLPMAAVASAAEKILRADILLVAVGAGFSADSGLPVYKDIADVLAYHQLGVDYQDLCDPYWIYDDISIFLGFWGESFNQYRNTTPHAGYDILKRWKQRLTCQLIKDKLANNNPTNTTTSPFFVFTSNVDSHCTRVFAKNEVYDVHGNTDHWQCAGSKEKSPPCCNDTWTLPPAFRFDVDHRTMLVHDTSSPLLQCPRCKGPGRPNVLMFRDKHWIPNDAAADRYHAWEDAVEDVLQQHPSKRLVVLEIGCGTRVETVRENNEELVQAVLESGGQATLIRVNPEVEDEDDSELSYPHLLSIHATGLATLQAIDHVIQSGLVAIPPCN